MPWVARNATTVSRTAGESASNGVAAHARNHVNWRLASWRVAAIPLARSRRRIDRAVKKFPCLPIPHAPHRRQIGRERELLSQRAKLVDESRREHRVEPAGDRVVQSRAVGRQQRDRHHRAGGTLNLPRTLQLRQRRPGQCEHLERALNALRIGGREACRGGGIDPRELRMHRRPACLPRLTVEPRAKGGVRSRQRAQAVGERFEVEHRAADQQRHAAARANGGDGGQRVGTESGGGIGLRRIDDVDEVMRDARTRRRVRLRRADVHAAINLRRIHTHDFGREAQGERQRERALARRGRAHQ